MTDITDEAAVRALLAAHGLAPSEEEITQLVAQYGPNRQGVELLYSVAKARYEAPALSFSATPVFDEWSDYSRPDR